MPSKVHSICSCSRYCRGARDFTDTRSWLPSPVNPAKCCAQRKARFTRRCIGWRRRAWLARRGSRRIRAARPPSTKRPPQAKSNWAWKSRAGSQSAWQSIGFSGRHNMSLWSRISNAVRGARLNREIEEELQSHIDEAIASGRDPREVHRAFGSALRAREEGYSIRAAGWLESLFADVSFGWRQLCRNQVTSFAAVLSLAIGTG